MEKQSEAENVPDASDARPEYSIGQLRRVSVLYDSLAKLLPTEGVDYSVEITFPDKDDPGRMSVKLKDYTRIGKLWCDYCREALKGGPR